MIVSVSATVKGAVTATKTVVVSVTVRDSDGNYRTKTNDRDVYRNLAWKDWKALLFLLRAEYIPRMSDEKTQCSGKRHGQVNIRGRLTDRPTHKAGCGVHAGK